MTRYTGVLDQPVATVTVDLDPDGISELIVAQPATTGATTIASASNGLELPQATITVASTTGFAASGAFYVMTQQPSQDAVTLVTYTGLGGGGTTFTGCTGGTGVLVTGAAVTGNKLVNWTGVDVWSTPDGNPPTLKTAANAIDHFVFRSVGGLVYGIHTNAPGRAGVPGSMGSVGVQPRGTYAAATAYVLNDIVTLNGSTYINIQAGTGQTPVVAGTAYWDVVAKSTGTVAPPDPDPHPIPIPIVFVPGTPTVSLDAKGAAARLINWCTLSRILGQITNTSYNGYTDDELGFLGTGPTTLNGGVPLGNTGLVLSIGRLMGAFPVRWWTGDPNVDVSKAGYEWQQQIQNTNLVARCRAHGLTKLYLGAYTANTYSPYVMLWPWFDDANWDSTPALDATQPARPIVRFRNFAAAAKKMGFDGIAFDNEPYTTNGIPPSWDWNYTNKPSSYTESQVRAKVKQRGQEMMTAILGVFPNAEIVSYHDGFDGGFIPLEQNIVNGAPLNAGSVNAVTINWWDGLTSVPGWSRIRIIDSGFYQTVSAHIAGANEETSMILSVNGQLAFLSQNLSNWNYANQRLSVTPFLWLGPTNGDGTGFSKNACPTPAQALANVQAARTYGMASYFFNYAYANELPRNFNYANFTQTTGTRIVNANFVPAYNAATAGTVDTVDPTISNIVITRDNATTVHATGTANDNIGIRAVRWINGANSGAAVHTFVVDSGTYQSTPANYLWHAAWTANGIPATAGQTITFVVEDVKGRAALYTAVAS